MISTEPVTVAGRAGRYADWRIHPELLRSWHRQALCGGVGSAVFFPADEECYPIRDRRERVAKAICAACPVRRPCAVHALAHRELHGVWGAVGDRPPRRLART
ncbi:WhiB family transcriptional regulator [Pseudonocardia humida]|uniref:Transcriptional regulator WhiB n=1 Tax=Pseudonocardia humida TaxID=2800819 RepID=A0ABT1AA50_9PSEU|nr:WhiB family transcriptional regulator [Pseudonocardia humida]MCO1659699.1 WhiB family transcriptional regulator [Pseudonocardia humida]